MPFTIQLAENVYESDIPFLNFTGVDLPPNTVVQLDTNYILSPTNTQDGIGVALPTGAGVKVLGVTLETIKSSGTLGIPGLAGRVRCFGPLAVCIGTGAIIGGSLVEADNATPGYVKLYAGPAYQVGLALTSTGATGDQILVMLDGANNQ